MDGLKNEKWMVNNFKTSSGITHESKSGQTKLYTCTVCQKVEIDQWKHAALGHGIWLLVHPSHAQIIEIRFITLGPQKLLASQHQFLDDTKPVCNI